MKSLLLLPFEVYDLYLSTKQFLGFKLTEKEQKFKKKKKKKKMELPVAIHNFMNRKGN